MVSGAVSALPEEGLYSPGVELRIERGVNDTHDFLLTWKNDMKKYALPLALVSAITLQACNQQSSAPAETGSVAPATVALETTEQRLSYGIAYNLGTRMKADGVPMDADAFSAGLRDSLEGSEPRMSEDEIAAEMQAYQEKMAAEQQAAQAELAVANAVAAEAFLAQNALVEGVVVTESGLQYQILEAADGPVPGAEDTVEVHYRGTLVDGTPKQTGR